MNYIKLTSIFILPLVLLGLFSSVAGAQEEGETGLVLRPAIMDLPAEPGTTVSATITLQNISDSPVSVEVGSQSLVPNDPEIDQQKRKDYDASTWVLTSGDALLLKEDEIRDVDVQFLVPPDAGPGGHYALVTFTTNSVSQLTDSGSTVTPSLTSLALITVAGDIVESAEAEEFGVPLFVFGEDQTTKFNIANTGNVHILPTAVLRMYDRSDQLVETQQIDSQLILPNTTKSFAVDWSTNGHIGLYKVVIDVNYGTPLKTISMESGVIVMLPNVAGVLLWLVLLGVGMAIAFVVVRGLFKKFRKRFGRRHYRISKKSKKPKETENHPADMARLSMESDRIDDLMGSDSSKPPPRPKRKKIVIK